MGPPDHSAAAAAATSSTTMLTSPPQGAGMMPAPAAPRRASLLEEEPACSSTLRRIFRFALRQVLSAGSQPEQGGQDGGAAPAANEARRGGGLDAEANARLPAEVLSLLERLVEAERAAATGAGGHGYYSSTVGKHEGGGHHGQQQHQPRQGGLATGKKRRLRESGGGAGKPRRRVSFSTFDLSVVDTPDPQRHGSDRPMEGVLSSLFLALKAAEGLRAGCQDEQSLQGAGSALQQLMAAAGKENLHNHQQQQQQPPSADGAKPAENEGMVEEEEAEAEEPAGGRVSKECVEQLVAALGTLASHASLAAMGKGPVAGNGEEEAGMARALALLGEHPNWSEVAAAASFYAKELRLLCLEPAAALPASRLLERYHETLSSMVRYELKKVLNLCYCGATGFGDDNGGSPTLHHHHQQQQQQQQQPMLHAAMNHAPTTTGEGAVDPFAACCSALQILVETAANLQYNSDDPAALLNFALQRLHAKRPAWLAFKAAATEATGPAPGDDAAAEQDQQQEVRGGQESKGGEEGDGLVGGVGGLAAEEDSNLMSLASQPTPTDAFCRQQEQQGQQGIEEEEGEEPGAKMMDGRRRSSVAPPGSLLSTAFPTPPWWPLAETQGEEVLGYLSAASFLLRVLEHPVVARAVAQGRWGRVERFAGMVSGVLNVPSEDESLRVLGDLGALGGELGEELEGAQRIREALLASTPPELLAAAPLSHYPDLHGHHPASHNSKKRKRAARLLKGHLKNVLVWARSCELPPALTYPHLVPLCVYAPPHEGPGGQGMEGEEEEAA